MKITKNQMYKMDKAREYIDTFRNNHYTYDEIAKILDVSTSRLYAFHTYKRESIELSEIILDHQRKNIKINYHEYEPYKQVNMPVSHKLNKQIKLYFAKNDIASTKKKYYINKWLRDGFENDTIIDIIATAYYKSLYHELPSGDDLKKFKESFI